MSYGVSVALQAAVYQHLQTDAQLGSLIGTAVFDEVPNGTIPSTYVTLGPEIAQDRSDKTDAGALHRFTVTVVSEEPGFSTSKAVAVAVSDALHQAELNLSRGHLISLMFERAAASREEAANLRRIDLRFAARVEDN
ncbi:MAG: DUF3168 domain-containing protein [Cognatishimia sp.]